MSFQMSSCLKHLSISWIALWKTFFYFLARSFQNISIPECKRQMCCHMLTKLLKHMITLNLHKRRKWRKNKKREYRTVHNLNSVVDAADTITGAADRNWLEGTCR